MLLVNMSLFADTARQYMFKVPKLEIELFYPLGTGSKIERI